MSQVVYEDFKTKERQEKFNRLEVGNIVPHEIRVMDAVARNEFATIDLRSVRNVLSEEPFTLDDDFIKQYEGKEPEWGEMGWFVFKRTYARRVEDENGESKRTEEWTETVRRVVEGNLNIIKNDPLVTQEYGQKMFDLIWNLVFTPPGRGLWISGTEFAKRTGDASNNCFRAGTLVHTDEGIFPIEELTGKTVNVLSQDGKYRPATFRSFGKQELMKVTLANGDVLYATPDHEWVIGYVNNGKLKIKKERVYTKDLSYGDYIPLNYAPITFRPDEKGVIHGFTYGDGWIVHDKYAEVKFFGDKESLIPLFQKHGYTISERSDAKTALQLPKDFKTVPETHEVSREYALGFIIGLISANGYVRSSIVIHNKDKDELEKIRKLAMYAGIRVGAIRVDRERSPFDGSHKPIYCFSLSTYHITKDMLIRPKQKRDHKVATRNLHTTSVISVERTGLYEEVYCCTEMETHTMTVGSGVLTGQCWYIESRPWYYGKDNLIFEQVEIDPNKKYVSFPFIFLFDQAMKGGGVGFSAEEDIIKEIPAPENRVNLYFYLDESHPDYEEVKAMAQKLGANFNVPYKENPNNKKVEITVRDSREGWCEVQAVNIDSHYNGGQDVDLLIDLSKVRSRGTPIRGFGGVASGSAPLLEVIHFYCITFNRFVGKKLTSVVVTDLHNATGRCVVAGNVRRTAEIAISTSNDDAFINMKNYKKYAWLGGWRQKEDGTWEQYSYTDEELLAQGYTQEEIDEARYAVWAQSNHRWASNNSIVLDDPRSYDFGFIAPAIETNGEPGILNRWLMRNFGRIIDGYREGIDGKVSGANPCGEISLESGEPCNLVELMLPVMYRKGIEPEEVIPFMVHFAKRVTFTKYDWEISRDVISRNRRLGVSLSGVADWILMKYGRKAVIGWKVYRKEDWHDMVWLDDDKPYVYFDYLPTEKDLIALAAFGAPWDDNKLKGRRARKIRKRLYKRYAEKGGDLYGDFKIEPVYNEALVKELDRMYKLVRTADIEYSALLTKALGYEVKPSIKVTTNKPSGTVALLPGVSPGVHHHYFKYGIRRVRLQESDPLLKLAQLCGYHTEPVYDNPGSWVIEFPVKAPSADIEGFVDAGHITIEEQFAMQNLMCVYWADNMVSCTITFHEHEKPKIKHLLEQYRMRIKSTSLLPYSGHGYKQAPYEPKDKEWYEETMKKIQFKPHELYHILMNSGEFQDREMTLEEALECATGACPTR